MKREPVDSSMISSIGYQVSTKTLEIEFRSGAVWQYSRFPKALWTEFKNCDSYGRFFRGEISGAFEEIQVSRKRRR